MGDEEKRGVWAKKSWAAGVAALKVAILQPRENNHIRLN